MPLPPFEFRARPYRATTCTFAVSAMLIASPLAQADSASASNEQVILQQQRQRALEQQLLPPTPDVRLAPPISPSGRLVFPQEKPCFTLDSVELNGQQTLPRWLPLQRIARQAQGQCLGARGINLLMSTLQNRLVDHGYITSRVLAPQQDLSRGRLTLSILPGLIHQVALTPDSGHYVSLFSAFPPRAGQLLDLRDIEQGLENLQRLPTVQASMEIVPAAQPGESDIMLDWRQAKIWRLGASLDDSGTKGTGRYQGGLTLSLDNPLSLSDLFYLSGSRALQSGNDKGSKNVTAHYSVPFRYAMLSVTANDYHYHQTVAGLNGDFRYSGNSENLTVQLSRVLHRSGSQKTTFSYDLLTRGSKNYINDTEVEVNRRRTAAWRVGLQHRHFIQQATLDAGFSYQHGTRWFGALPAPEEFDGEATALSKIVQLSSQLNLPFSLGSQAFRYNLQYQQQISHTALTPQDQFAIGGRFTVRGFDGERTLNANAGWTLRNELAWSTPLQNQELYLGADYGHVSGHGSDDLVGTKLAGSVLGVRGAAFKTRYDLFAGVPLYKPAGFRTSPVTLGFTLNWDI